ncbi:MAG: D-glycero-beta-D-manno-heptose 1,7-bisphosphate 7-phosphatase [Pseudomonadales bacterium]
MKLVILDRDGVINEDSDAFVKNADEWIPIVGSIRAIARLSKAGFTVVVATNQSGLGRGIFDLGDLEAMHDKMYDLVNKAGGEIDAVFYCPHHPDDHCNCRKPKAGLINAIEQELAVCAKDASVVGDSLRDLQAGLLKGCKPILVKTGKGKRTLARIEAENNPDFANLAVYNNLAEVADALIESL